MTNRLIIGLIFLIGLSFNSYSQVDKANKKAVRYAYMVYEPNDYSINKQDSFPVLIYLHGGSHRGNDLELLKGYGLPKLIDEGKDYDFIVVSPQCPIDKYWTTENWFDSLYLDLKTKYRLDTTRIFATGISMGGFGTWELAMDYPDLIKAIVPLCGGCNDSLNICKIKHIPIWTFHGVKDNSIPINETERLVNRLEECYGKIKFTRLENRGHGIQDIYDNDEIYNWIAKQ